MERDILWKQGQIDRKIPDAFRSKQQTNKQKKEFSRNAFDNDNKKYEEKFHRKLLLIQCDEQFMINIWI